MNSFNVAFGTWLAAAVYRQKLPYALKPNDRAQGLRLFFLRRVGLTPSTLTLLPTVEPGLIRLVWGDLNLFLLQPILRHVDAAAKPHAGVSLHVLQKILDDLRQSGPSAGEVMNRQAKLHRMAR